MPRLLPALQYECCWRDHPEPCPGDLCRHVLTIVKSHRKYIFNMIKKRQSTLQISCTGLHSHSRAQRLSVPTSLYILCFLPSTWVVVSVGLPLMAPGTQACLLMLVSFWATSLPMNSCSDTLFIFFSIEISAFYWLTCRSSLYFLNVNPLKVLDIINIPSFLPAAY